MPTSEVTKRHLGHQKVTVTVTNSHPFCSILIAPPFWDTSISKFDLGNPRSLEIQGQSHGQDQNWWYCIWGIMFYQYIHFSLHGNRIILPLRYSKLNNIWPWWKSWPRSIPNDCIWGREFNRYVCFFIVWQSNHFWLRYSKFYIWPWKFKGQGHNKKSIKI